MFSKCIGAALHPVQPQSLHLTPNPILLTVSYLPTSPQISYFYQLAYFTMNILLHLLVFLIDALIALLSLCSHHLRSRFSEKAAEEEDLDEDPWLVQVHPLNDETETDIDIIAIHGLDTKSPDTWEYKINGKPPSNWLKDKAMLPSMIGNARIFTCDWLTKKFESPDTAKLRIEEIAQSLVVAINARPQGDNRNRPILFVASCFGGIILMRALSYAVHQDPILSCTRGVIFLATPFDGTAFGKIAYWARPALSFQAWLKGFKLSPRFDYVEEGRWKLHDLTEQFHHRCLEYNYSTFAFYETEGTNLLAKNLPKALNWISKKELLVERRSAAPPMFKEHPGPLHRPHAKMNKFHGPGDKDFKSVAEKIQQYLREIREGTSLERLDKELYRYYNTDKRLQVERLSEDKVSMDVCYINLTIVEQSTLGSGFSNKAQDKTSSSPFSLANRLGVETPDDEVQIDIPKIFSRLGKSEAPKRVLIRGRAGIGKTTLCKKIVHDFLLGRIWEDLFDRIFWLPLRDLKLPNNKVKNMGELFDKYISGPGKEDLAHGAWTALDQSNYDRTIFVLDGLDEVSQGLPGDYDILRELMRLPNLIVTSRPYVSLPAWLGEKDIFDLELETIGFYPDQVKSYVQTYFINEECKPPEPEKAEVILSFLHRHPLMQSLMRIPVQLDALCWTWAWDNASAGDDDSQPQTMTAIYKAIEERLWRKDAEKLGRKLGHHQLSTEVNDLVKPEAHILELLAFAGIYSDVIDFRPEDRNLIYIHSERSPEDFHGRLDRLSFLRCSSPSSDSKEDRNYHFLHLTFQEYFAAQYFVRQWKANEDLDCLKLNAGHRSARHRNHISPTKFLGQNKYNTRYNIVWRFVAGILDLDGELEELERFFRTLDQKPLDLLGVVHQRLLMHCLNETGSDFSLRSKIEDHLSKWLVFQCRSMQPVRKIYPPRMYRYQTLASEAEFPGKAFAGLLDECDGVKMVGFDSIRRVVRIPLRVTENLISMLDTASDAEAQSAISLLNRSSDSLPEKVLLSIASRLWRKTNSTAAITQCSSDLSQRDDRKPASFARANICEVVASILQSYKLPEDLWCEIAMKLKSMNSTARDHASQILASQQIPRDQILFDFIDQLEGIDQPESQSRKSRAVAKQFLRHQSTFPSKVLSLIQEKIGSESTDTRVRNASIYALGGHSKLPESLIRLLATKLYQDQEAIRETLQVLSRLSNLPDNLSTEVILSKDLEEENDHWLRYNKLSSEWCRKTRLSEKALEVLAGHLKSPASSVRFSVIHILDGQSNLPEEILQEIGKCLQDEDHRARVAATNALSHRPCSSEPTIGGITSLLDERLSGFSLAKLSALRVLKHQSNLPKTALNKIANCIDHPDPAIKIAAIDALSGRSGSPDILNKIMTQIEDQSAGAVRAVTSGVIEAAIKAFNISYASIPNSWLTVIESEINEEDKTTRNDAVQALIRLRDISEEHLNLLAARINDEDIKTRLAAVGFLEGKHTLAESTLQIMVTQICDSKNLNLADPMNSPFFCRSLITMFMQRDTLHSEVLLRRGQVHRFLLPLLQRTFSEHFSWYFQDGESYLIRDNETRRQSLCNEDDLEAGMDLARQETGFPSVVVSY
ncbi:unnamed protein product [Penicillium salamii]|uniref:NACHT domain-containing protein n=1 Tax=Penicillium salamii TaxID=1612424 RepID=A0A9W4NIG6_9EURO|nr:unnamed protein product [Penicillium salamii]CAG8125599.1 unnamed protein product [Penicillium salamii]CAG8223979.1 unnamed protein product [Penicillium salamii]CAG8305269.1 unnamed protein product [Penicillium salamii]CAG8327298.1 unnamed protein product [Penicillium salamii]